MADLKKLVLGTTEFDVVDQGARTQVADINSFVCNNGTTDLKLTMSCDGEALTITVPD